MSVYLVVIVAYFALVVAVGMGTRRLASRSAAEYLVAGRNLGLGVCAVVVASEWLGGLSTIGVSEQAFRLGSLEPILYNVATATGMVIIGFTVASHYRRKQVHTVSEMVASLFGPRARHVSAVAFLIAYVTLAYVELQTCASVLSPLFHLSWPAAVVISAAIITLYTYMGGMHALAIAAILYLATRYLGLGTAVLIGLGKVGGFAGLQQKLIAVGGPANYYNPFAGDPASALSLLLGGILGGMAAQASIQPIFAAKDVRTAKRAAILAALFIPPYGLMTAVLGLMARTGLFFDPTTIVAVARRLVVLVTLAIIPLAIFIRGAILDSGYVSYAIRAIGAIVILVGIYRSRWISSLAANLAFTIGTAVILLCVLANRLQWFAVDKTYGAVATTLLVILLVNAYEWLTGKKRADPASPTPHLPH